MAWERGTPTRTADFAEAVADPVAAERLTLALEGRGAFRRFRDTVHDQPEALIHPLR
jgi:hypothetical protein